MRESQNMMKNGMMTVTTFVSKPSVGIVGGLGSGLSALLTFVGIVGPIIGFVATCLGCIVAYYHLRIIIRKWKKNED